MRQYIRQKLKESIIQFINIDSILLDKELVLVDTTKPLEIINVYKSGKMPLDKKRVESLTKSIELGKSIPPIELYHNNKLKDGHHRYAAYKIVGIKNIPFIYM